VPLLKHINNLILYKPTQKSLSTNYYEHIRDKALDNLLDNFIVKNSSFVFEHNLNGILGSNSMRDLLFALSGLKLNKEESWNLIKTKFKPFVMCVVCNSQINWKTDEIIETLDSERKLCKQIITDNWYLHILIVFKQIINQVFQTLIIIYTYCVLFVALMNLNQINTYT